LRRNARMPALSSVVRGTGFYGRMIALMFQSFTGKHNPGQRPEYAIGRPTKCQARAGFYTSRGIGRGHQSSTVPLWCPSVRRRRS